MELQNKKVVRGAPTRVDGGWVYVWAEHRWLISRKPLPSQSP